MHVNNKINCTGSVPLNSLRSPSVSYTLPPMHQSCSREGVGDKNGAITYLEYWYFKNGPLTSFCSRKSVI